MSDQEEKLAELVEDKKIWQGLLSHPGWDKLVAVLQDQADQLQFQVVHQPLESMDQVLKQEWQKGKLCGLLLVSEVVQGNLDDIQQEIDFLRGTEDAAG